MDLTRVAPFLNPPTIIHFSWLQDFNREPHYIERNTDVPAVRADGNTFRVVLKVHYVVYPVVFR